jgi:coenzyme PQQ precursor peptide PqqA
MPERFLLLGIFAETETIRTITGCKGVFGTPKNAVIVRRSTAMQIWEKPSFTVVSLGAEVTAYLGSDTDATPV